MPSEADGSSCESRQGDRGYSSTPGRLMNADDQRVFGGRVRIDNDGVIGCRGNGSHPCPQFLVHRAEIHRLRLRFCRVGYIELRAICLRDNPHNHCFSGWDIDHIEIVGLSANMAGCASCTMIAFNVKALFLVLRKKRPRRQGKEKQRYSKTRRLNHSWAQTFLS